MLQRVQHNEASERQAPRLFRLKLAYDLLSPLFAVTDIVIIAAAILVGCVSYQRFISDGFGDIASYSGVGLVSGLAYAFVGGQFGIYRVSSLLQPRRDYGQIFAGWLFVVLLMALLLFLFKIGASFSRGSIILAAATMLLALIAWRKVVKAYLRTALASGAIEGRRALLVGTKSELENFDHDQLLFGFGVNEVARVVLPTHAVGVATTSPFEVVAFENAIAQSRHTSAEEIILALPWGNTAHLNIVREWLRTSPLPARLLPDQFIRSIWEGEASVDEHHRLIDLQRAPLTRTEQFLKRQFDIVIASLLLVILSPLLVMVGIIIKLDSRGSIIFRQRRKGFNGQDFVIYKFRTMAVAQDGATIPQAKKHDPRVTRFGRLLRRSSIDELPQLFNVLKGDMSLVGPRPHALAHDDQYNAVVAKYAFRHHVKPGITGWAQVNGLRGETSQLGQMQRRVEFDIWYINNWSLTLDVQILLRTIVEQMRSRQAY
jgi:undecaprenyl-phosphate galactose phosphotransferase/putative colanic acid biosynthesis UDP-glucose lipid carrier transferase